MILEKVQSIMLTGINKFAKEFGVENTDSQIQVVMLQDGSIIYKKCKEFTPIEQVKFTEIMDTKFDFLGYQTLVRPFMQQSIIDYASEFNASPLDVTGFIFLHTNNVLHIALYNKTTFMKSYTLLQHFEKLGIA